MGMHRFKKWLENIYNTQEEEISCSECFDLVSNYVELEITGEDPATHLSQVKQHIKQCPVCREEYEALRDLRRLEEQGETPSIDDLRDLIH